MVTEEHFWGKPTYGAIVLALRRAHEYATQFNVKNVAYPRISCGLDRKNWGLFSKLIKFIFHDSGISIKIYVIQTLF
ncbi:unnamed protein product [Acanthoscelides obtectus]|uniref:Macro domain-containing protein n=1 Tax=Acanthoscelides obtectus TaxID=200917 RepID=A0A9P0P6P7_ACAOB|nr:unnamed protein product [Acanthoscelides obtectus]CAK1657538.1 O-acetyl-ADP-ribose deacetylase 1 [Acanthoscelides obtectus]